MHGGIVLAGGRSTRMGTPKADLEWHGTTLAHHMAGTLARCVDGPVVVVRAPAQQLPPLPENVETAQDAVEGRGPLEGIVAGLAALEGRAATAFVVAVDMPLLHPDFVRAVLEQLGDEHDIALPVDADGHRQPLAAAYRVALRPLAEQVAGSAQRSARALLDRCRVNEITAFPHPESLTGLNTPEAYAAARHRG